MNGLSDLDLVAQAMAPTNVPSQKITAESIDQSPLPDSTAQSAPAQTISTNQNHPGSTTDSASKSQTTEEKLLSLGIDPSTLSESDLAALQPIINALSLGDGEVEGDGEEDELRIAEILAQMDAAGSVADDLEGKLDELLKNLGETEKQMQAANEEK